MRNIKNQDDENDQHGPVDPVVLHEMTKGIELDPEFVPVPLTSTNSNKKFSLRSLINRVFGKSQTPGTRGPK